MSQGPTSSTDRVCSSCQLGVSFQTSDNHVLKTCTFASPACSPGTYEQVPPTVSSDRSCAPCLSGYYQDKSGQSSCAEVTGCDPGQYLTMNATTSTNRICANCNGVSLYQNLAGQINWYRSLEMKCDVLFLVLFFLILTISSFQC